MQAVVDRSAVYIADLLYQIGAGSPTGWLVLGGAMAVLFMFLIRPAR